MHLTLKFLGNTPEDLVPRIREAARSVASGLNGASLVVAGLGAFPDAQRPRVLWVGLHGDVDVLAHAALGLSDALEPLGFPEDARPWAPHVTLARARTGVRMGPVSGIAQDFARTEFGRFTASEMVLYRSELTPRGAVYTALDRFPFLTR
jgi:2'-5' RNA ligase